MLVSPGSPVSLYRSGTLQPISQLGSGHNSALIQKPQSGFWEDRALRGNVPLGLPQSKDLSNRIAKQILNANQLDLPVDVHIVEGQRYGVNSTSRGNIFINLDTLKKAQSPEEIAFLLAHEIAHIRDKDAKKMKLENGLFLGLMTLGLIFSESVVAFGLGFATLVGGVQLSGVQGRSRELKADINAVQLLRQAGYSPWGSHTALANLKKEEEQLPKWMKVFYKLTGISPPKIEKRQLNLTGLVNGYTANSVGHSPLNALEWNQLKIEAFSNPQRILPTEKL